MNIELAKRKLKECGYEVRGSSTFGYKIYKDGEFYVSIPSYKALVNFAKEAIK